MKSEISRKMEEVSQDWDEALLETAVRHRGMFHIPASYTDCKEKSLQQRFQPNNLGHQLKAWDVVAQIVSFNDHHLVDVLAGFIGRKTHVLASSKESNQCMTSLLFGNSRDSAELGLLFQRFKANDGVIDVDEKKQLLDFAKELEASLKTTIGTMESLPDIDVGPRLKRVGQ